METAPFTANEKAAFILIEICFGLWFLLSLLSFITFLYVGLFKKFWIDQIKYLSLFVYFLNLCTFYINIVLLIDLYPNRDHLGYFITIIIFLCLSRICSWCVALVYSIETDIEHNHYRWYDNFDIPSPHTLINFYYLFDAFFFLLSGFGDAMELYSSRVLYIEFFTIYNRKFLTNSRRFRFVTDTVLYQVVCIAIQIALFASDSNNVLFLCCVVVSALSILLNIAMYFKDRVTVNNNKNIKIYDFTLNIRSKEWTRYHLHTKRIYARVLKEVVFKDEIYRNAIQIGEIRQWRERASAGRPPFEILKSLTDKIGSRIEIRFDRRVSTEFNAIWQNVFETPPKSDEAKQIHASWKMSMEEALNMKCSMDYASYGTYAFHVTKGTVISNWITVNDREYDEHGNVKNTDSTPLKTKDVHVTSSAY